MDLHSNGLFCLWTASGCIDHPRMACFTFLARDKNALSRCNDHFVRGSKSKSGFTLIELLVVISIMLLLMSILMPSLSNARKQGKRISCASNLRSLQEAWLMYALDYDDKLCSADTGNIDQENYKHWVNDGLDVPGNSVGGTEEAIKIGSLWRYTGKSLDLYHCNSDRSDHLRSYAISRAMHGKTCNCEHDNIKPFHLLNEIHQASEKMVFIDAESQINWIEGSFCAVADIDAIDPVWYRRPSRNISARHLKGCNLSFADGHCEYWKYRDPRTVALANWEITPEKASPGNPDLQHMVQLLQGNEE